VNSDFIDLNVWTLMNLPLIRPVDLHTFWGSGDLQLVTTVSCIQRSLVA
jgi:hypothetical protein